MVMEAPQAEGGICREAADQIRPCDFYLIQGKQYALMDAKYYTCYK